MNKKDFKKIGPFKGWVIQNFPFIEEDFDAITEYQLYCKIVEYLNKVIYNELLLEESDNELIDAFNELKNYVDNLDIQEEVNNKLNEMAIDGTLEHIINEEIFTELNNKVENLETKTSILDKNSEVHFVYRGQNGGDCSVIKTKDKITIIDFGIYDDISNFILYLIANDLTKIDYVILTHMDTDHTGTFTGFKQVLENPNLDFSECTFITHPAPNWATYTGDLSYQEKYEEIITYLTLNGYTIKYPEELEEIELDTNNKFKFYNVNPEFYDSYTTLVANAFSVVTELITNNNHILFTGDLIEASENIIYNELNKIDLLKIPHHGVEKFDSSNFMRKIDPNIGVLMNTTTTYVNRFMPRFFLDNKDKTLYTSNESGNIIVSSIGNKLEINSANGAYSTNYSNVITSNMDLNNITKTGIYQCNDDTVSASLSNMPYNYGTEHYHSQFLLEVVEITSSVIIQTMQTLNTDNIIWTRKYNGSWTEWQKYRISTFNFLRAKMTNNQNISTANSWATLNLDDSSGYVINNALTLDTTNHTIKIGKGVHHVQVSAQATWNGVTANDRLNFAVFKNSDRTMSNDTTSAGAYITQTVAPFIITVNENDTIKLQVRNINSATSLVSKTGYDTFLEVSVID